MDAQEEKIFMLKLEGLRNQFDSQWRTTSDVGDMAQDDTADGIVVKSTDERLIYEAQYKSLILRRIKYKRSLQR